MKKLFYLTVFAAGMLGTGYLYAQKLGHTNSIELVSLMPETKAADAELKKLGDQLEGQLKTMTTEYQSKVQDFQSKESMMADAVKQTKYKEITDLESRIQDFHQTAQETIQKKKEDLYAPVMKKVQDAINAVAKENGYLYIIDLSAGSLLYADESGDITALVKKKLGIPAEAKATLAPAPAAK